MHSGKAKLYFYYGAMGSSKTAQLLINAFNCMERGMNPVLFTSATDTRTSGGCISSRIGLSEKAVPLSAGDDIFSIVKDMHRKSHVHAVFADEVNLMTVDHVEGMAKIVDDLSIPVMAYGIRTDFRTRFFPSTLRLMEIADTIHEIRTLCHCGNKATVNTRIANGRVVREGPQVMVGGNESYTALCRKCWKKGLLHSARKDDTAL